MPVARPLKSLYIAKSLEELNQNQSKVIIDVQKSNITNTIKTTHKMFDAAKDALEKGDEERAYVLLMRFVDHSFNIRKSSAYKNDAKFFELMLGSSKVSEAIEYCEKLSESLKRRYSDLSESIDARNKEINNSINLHVNDNKTVNADVVNDDSTIECITLMDYIENSKELTELLIIDTRTAEEFESSHIKLKPYSDVSIINIPANILIPGITVSRIKPHLPLGKTLDAFERRRTMKKIVIIDRCSEEIIKGTPSECLIDALWKWDNSPTKPKSPPLLLKGGYRSWVLTYPMHSTNSAAIMDKSYDSVSPKATLNVNYDFNEENEKPAETVKTQVNNNIVNGETEHKSDVNSEELELHNRLNNIFPSKIIDTPKPGTAKRMPIIPDRSMKPKETKNNENTVDVNNKIGNHNDVEKFLLRKQIESSEEMINSVNDSQNKLRQQIKEYEEKQLKDEEFKRQLLEENVKMRAQISKEPNKDKDIPSDELNGDSGIKKFAMMKVDEKVNNHIGNGVKPNLSLNGDLSENENSKSPIRPKLSNISKSPNMLSVGGSMSRSLSSPNIAQLLAEEENDKELNPNKFRFTTNPPQFDRTLKANVINKEKLFESTVSMVNDNKIRDFSPVYGIAGQTITGLRNLGNTCFMNAVIQCLLNTVEFTMFFNEKLMINRNAKFGSNGELVLEMAALIKAMAFPAQYKSIAPKDFRNAVSKHLPDFTGCDQQDAHEFMVMLFTKLHADLNQSSDSIIEQTISDDTPTHLAVEKFWKNHKLKNNSIITNLFEGLLVQTLTCLYCRKNSKTFETYNHLSLLLPSHRCTLSECLQSFFRPEKMSGEAAWECPTCKQKRDAEKKIMIYKLPKVLIVHLKRFSYEGVWRQKLQTYVEFPIDDLHMNHSTVVQRHYRLYGVVNHYGTLEGGHYTAFSKHPFKNRWYKYDDHEVTVSNQTDIKTQAAYVLFYISD